MDDKKVIELYQKMVAGHKDYREGRSYPKRVPTIPTMTKYINHVFGEFGFKAKCEKGTVPGRYLHTQRNGTRVVVKKGRKEVHSFSNVYNEPNAQFAGYILDLHKEYRPGIERDIKIDSLLSED